MTDESRSILKFIFRSLAATWPLLLLIVVYVAIDPFKVVFYHPENQVGSRLPYNKGVISTEAYLHGRKINGYDSFIFGSSRTIRFHTDKWLQYLDCTASPFHFDASDDTPRGILQKMKLIDSLGDTIKNAMVELSPTSFHKQLETLPYRAHWRLTSMADYLPFQTSYFRDFLHWSLFKAIVIYETSGVLPDPDDNVSLLFTRFHVDDYDETTNEERYTTAESLFADSTLAGRYPVYADTLFNEVKVSQTDIDIEALNEIRTIFQRHDTDYVIIFGPDARHRVLPESVVSQIKEIFGPDHVYDMERFRPAFNGTMTFYDDIHFTVDIANEIIDSVYIYRRSYP